MCRVLSYLGTATKLENMLYNADNSFVTQSYHPKYMSLLLNLAGFGIATWDEEARDAKYPMIYRTLQLPFYDENLHYIATKTLPYSFLAHLRGVTFSMQEIVSHQNVHPFNLMGSNLAFAHNGDLYGFNAMKYDLLKFIKPEYIPSIKGTTDSEWIYYVFLSQLGEIKIDYSDNEILEALRNTLDIFKNIRTKLKINFNSPVNIFIANGEFILATRYSFDFGWEPPADAYDQSEYHSLWYTVGDEYGSYNHEYRMNDINSRKSIIISSEPLTQDTSTWLEVPEYTLLFARREKDGIHIISHDINL